VRERDHRWIRPETATVRVRRWDDECLLYDTRRGNTHLLSPVASCILHDLPCEHGATLDELTSLSAARLQRGVDAELRAEVEAAMLRLQALGLSSLASS